MDLEHEDINAKDTEANLEIYAGIKVLKFQFNIFEVE